MIFEVYGVVSDLGSNTLICRNNSMKRAVRAARAKINPNIFFMFAILKKERICSAPIAIYAGLTFGDTAFTLTKCKSFLTGENPLANKGNSHEILSFWRSV